MPSMHITVKLFGSLRRYLPKDAHNGTCGIDLQEDATVKDLVGHLKIPAPTPKTVLVNGRHTAGTQKLTSGDVVSIITPISGGQPILVC